MKITNYDEYGSSICQWFQKGFPKVTNISNTHLLEILTLLIISTKENRYGPLPSPERLVNIRKVIKSAIDKGLPIPMLTGWGGRKPIVDSTVDVAEVFAILQILNLDTEIKKYFSPGIQVNIRIEDTNAEWLYRNDPETSHIVQKYSSDFLTLLSILQSSPTITGIRESTMMSKSKYFALSKEYASLLFKVISFQIAYPDANFKVLEEFQQLRELGWQGDINAEQRNYYFNRYKNMSPGLTTAEYVKMIADYFGGAKARYDLNGRAEPVSDVEGFIQLTFVPTVPGAPESIFSNAAYWRTIPLSQGRTHIPPWRAKGYFKINGEAIAKITSFNDPFVKELIPSTTILQRGDTQLEIATDYIIMQ